MDKKNTLLLTVIAIATLLVAVVGATFAYFSAQVGNGNSTNMTVTTSSEDSLSYGSFKPLYIIANQTNFADVSQGTEEDIGSQRGTAEGQVSLRVGDRGNDEGYCYNATIEITANNFNYSTFDNFDFKDDSDKPSSSSEHAPELLLKITKTTKDNSSDGTTITYGSTSNNSFYYVNKDNYKSGSFDESGTEIKYYHLKQQRRVCDQTGSTADAGTSATEYECQNDQTLEGYDITEVRTGNTILIPATDTASYSKTDINHKIQGESNHIITHDWKAELVFVNYNWDQQYNVGKVFTATWNFKPVNCEDGSLIESE